MNKKILISLCTIVAVAAIVVGVTRAYFSDTETSTGNTFTAGELDLKVDSTCHYNGKVCMQDATGAPYHWEGSQIPCSCTWTETDLIDHLFFNFLDVKPGDRGEDTISLKAVNNDAWLCANIKNLKKFENGCTEPEAVVDSDCGNPGQGEGELQQKIHMKIWMDVSNQGTAVPCDNILQPEELVLVEDTVIDSNAGVYPLGQIRGDQKVCLGVAWWIPSEVGNIIQGDSVTGDISFYAEQVRNNPDFICPGLRVD